jgi:hypothetical protein
MGMQFLRHDDFGAAPRISAWSTSPDTHGKRPNAAQLDAVTPRHRSDHLVKDGVNDLLSIATAEI